MWAFATAPTGIYAPVSTPAQSIFGLSVFFLATLLAIFVVVFSLLAYAVVRFRERAESDSTEPPQIYGSSQVELAWTIIPTLIVVALFLASAHVIASVVDAKPPSGSTEVVVVGHQYWWEYRYPGLHVVTANELHVPVGPTFLTLLSADTDHSFWVPRLAGKTDLIPNHPNRMWIDPHEVGLFLGQCAQYCGTQHAKMLLRVYVQSKVDFDSWIRSQQAPAAKSALRGEVVFQTTACVSCHTISGTAAKGKFGPDLTHLMSRDTLASGAVENTPENLRRWIQNPDSIKPGSKMPAMQLSNADITALTSYLETLH